MLVHGGDIAGYIERYGKAPLDFSANISPLGLPEGVGAAIVAALATADRYPDPLSRELTAAIAKAEGISPQSILCGNGAADLIFRLVLAQRPKIALLPAPTFAEYEQALATVGCAVRRHLLQRADSFAFTESILEKITPEVDILFLCQPNNPTGQLCGMPLLGRILEACEQRNVLLVVDECFVDFLDCPECYTMRGRLSSPNLFILKAFTKLYGMAGVRLGYGLCGNEKLMEKMRSCGQPWSVSGLAQAAGIAALGQGEYVRQVRTLVQEQRPWLCEQLKSLGIACLGATANYIFFESIGELDRLLAQRGVLIRSCANYVGLADGYYRIAVRTADENERLIAAMREALARA